MVFLRMLQNPSINILSPGTPDILSKPSIIIISNFYSRPHYLGPVLKLLNDIRINIVIVICFLGFRLFVNLLNVEISHYFLFTVVLFDELFYFPIHARNFSYLEN